MFCFLFKIILKIKCVFNLQKCSAATFMVVNYFLKNYSYVSEAFERHPLGEQPLSWQQI